MPHAKFVLLPASDQTHGHGSHSWAVLWQDRMAGFLRRTRAEKLNFAAVLAARWFRRGRRFR